MSDREYVDWLPQGRVRGRGAGLNPGNRFDGIRLHVLGDHLDEQLREQPHGTQARTEILEDRTRSIINRVDSPDLAMSWTINPYRGCEHGCIYCYARPGHEYLGLSSGLDFETKIHAKRNAPELLRKELASPKWRGDPIAMSGVTDCYQPLERRLTITRQCLAVMAECRQPVGIVTKNRLVTRDLDLLAELNCHRAVKVAISITTLDARLAAAMEPRASRPEDRLRTIAELHEAGIPVTVMVAPVIPGLTDVEVPAILEAAAEAGACSAGWVLLRLPHQIKALFLDWLAREVPDRAERVESLIRQTHGGELYESGFGVRQRGRGPWAEQIARTFDVFSRRHRLDGGSGSLSSEDFRRPSPDRQMGQMGLFDAPGF